METAWHLSVKNDRNPFTNAKRHFKAPDKDDVVRYGRQRYGWQAALSRRLRSETFLTSAAFRMSDIQTSLAPFRSSGFDDMQTVAVASDCHFQDVP